MNTELLQRIAAHYGWRQAVWLPYGNGLINRTWKVQDGRSYFILQRINEQVFQQPASIAHNIRLVSGYLKKHHPDYFFVHPLTTIRGEDLLHLEDAGWFRVLPFVEAHSLVAVRHPDEAYEAAAAFAKFTRLLSGFDNRLLKITIPGFHDLGLRYQQFENAVHKGNPERIGAAKEMIRQLRSHAGILATYKKLAGHPEFRLRVMHHDAKISNVLFNAARQVVCIIDPDTIMPGFFFSDVGDMIRTYVPPVDEEENDPGRVMVRREILRAVREGYFSEMGDQLTGLERQHFYFSGRFMVYMQALRFLTDHLNNDVYYGARYPDHNLFRAANQLALLEKLTEAEKAQPE